MEIRCPICNDNLEFLSEMKRDEHCDLCLDKADFMEPRNDVVIKREPTPELRPVKRPKLDNEKENLFFAKLTQSQKEKKPPAPKVVKTMPFYKTLKFSSATFAVDAFSYGAIDGVNSYFLTHFHSDHYGGLTKSWSHGLIYCSPATARLVNLKLKVDWKYLKPLEMDTEHTIEDVVVKLFDANHCPGASIMVFNYNILHTGDFRATNELTSQVLSYCSAMDTVYLDTTYLDPNRAFPDQDSVVDVCSKYCLEMQNKSMPTNFFTSQPKERKIVVFVGTYTIGKERLAIAIAKLLNNKIFAPYPKVSVLKAIDDPTLNELMFDDGTDAQVHLCSMRDMNIKTLEEKWKHLKKHFTNMIAFIPTGWTWKSNSSSFTRETLETSSCTKSYNNGLIKIISVPYSEHSSFAELEAFCAKVKSKNLISTVPTKRYDLLRSWEYSKRR